MSQQSKCKLFNEAAHRRDQPRKRAIYENLGVTEYGQHDPTGEFLPALLIGHRLNAKGAYEPVPLATKPDGTRYAESRTLARHLCLDNEGRLRLHDPATGKFLRKEDDEASAEKDRIIEDKDRIIEELQRRLAAANARPPTRRHPLSPLPRRHRFSPSRSRSPRLQKQPPATGPTDSA